MLVTVLQRDFGVTYDVDWFNNPPDHTDSKSVFIHGILSGRGGTCCSLPVLYAAVARRLGYPLRIVSSVSHLFARWHAELKANRFNIETTARGFISHSDKHYRTWPKPMRPKDLAGSFYLSSYTPQQELATFYQTRALCFFDWSEFGKAMQVVHAACCLFPEEPNLQGLHAIATILHRHKSGLESYDRRSGMVHEKNRTRFMEPWEQWAINAAAGEIRRLRSIHADRKPTSPNSTDAAFAAFTA